MCRRIHVKEIEKLVLAITDYVWSLYEEPCGRGNVGFVSFKDSESMYEKQNATDFEVLGK